MRKSLKIHYEWIESNGEDITDTIILVHGIGLDMYSWDFVIPYFKRNYNILRYDLRGHGQSDGGAEKKTIDLLCQDLKFIVKELNISSYYFVGQGFGGFIGVQIAGEKEGLLKSLILIGVPLHYPKLLGDKITRERMGQVQGHKSMLTLGEPLVSQICYIPSKRKEKILLNAYSKVSPTTYFELFQIGYGSVGAKSLQQTEVPILLLSGSEDAIYPPELFSASLNFNPNASYMTVPYASFMIQMDQPKLTAQWITRFIEKNKGRDLLTSLPGNEYKRYLTMEMYAEIRELLYRNQEDILLAAENNIQLDILNGFRVSVNGVPITEGWGKRKAKQIFVYLVIQRTVTRDILCETFWHGLELKNARNCLRVAIHHLKQILEPSAHLESNPIITTDREHISIHGQIQSDLLIHLAKIREGHQIDDMEQKVKHYRSMLKEASENILLGLFEDWFLDLRDSIESEWGEMALFLVNYYDQKNNHKEELFYLNMALKYYGDYNHLKKKMIQLQKNIFLK